MTNLHRNVIFQGADRLPAVLFSRFHSQNPEGCDWMDGLRQNGIEALAIPHNSNGSNGQMFNGRLGNNPVDDEWGGEYETSLWSRLPKSRVRQNNPLLRH